MNIKDDHLYHGAALTQIAEHERFTAINAVRYKGRISRSSFLINDSTAVFLKYASDPKGKLNEYTFTFRSDHLEEIALLKRKYDSVFGALVCVWDREICCISNSQLQTMIDDRRKAIKRIESQYTIIVGLPQGGRFRVAIPEPGARNSYLGKQLFIPRKDFPAALFV